MSRALVAAFGLLGLACASYPHNPPVDRIDPESGYRFRQLERGPKNSDSTFVVLTLSGGGTRAAALSYGAMRELERAKLPDGRTLLDEVDVISSVSGGSFAAAYYGLFGKKKFFEDFEADVLERQIEADLIWRLVNPLNWFRLASTKFSRSDLADRYYAEEIFDNATFDRMKKHRPFIMLNATDISLGVPFTFGQEHFDRLCSDLGPVGISRGVVASSAFPAAFPPLTIDNYPSTQCDYEAPAWVRLAYPNDIVANPRRFNRAKAWRSYEDPKRRYLHLSDGGLSDNIGLRRPAWSLMSNDSPWSIYNRLNNASGSPGPIERVIVIVVDAKPEGQPELDTSPRAPGITTVIESAATDPMENFSAETVELMREHFEQWAREPGRWERRRAVCEKFAAASRRTECLEEAVATKNDEPVSARLYNVHMRFDAITNADEQLRLEAIPTRLQLPKEDVDLLITAASRLLTESDEYQRILDDLGATRQTNP